MGIDGVFAEVQEAMHDKTGDMQHALTDLRALMSKAKQMADYAASLRRDLEQHERIAGNDLSVENASSLIQSSLVQLGLPAPAVTPDMVRDEVAYHEELARELATLLQGGDGRPGLMQCAADSDVRASAEPAMAPRAPGIVALDEVWGMWNRARGVALVSPKVFRAAVEYLPRVSSPRIAPRTLRSGIMVLHTPHFDDEAFEARLLQMLATAEGIGDAQDTAARTDAYPDMARVHIDESRGMRARPALAPVAPLPRAFGNGVTTMEIAEREGTSFALTLELIEGVEARSGVVVRDEVHHTRWHRNWICT